MKTVLRQIRAIKTTKMRDIMQRNGDPIRDELKELAELQKELVEQITHLTDAAVSGSSSLIS